MSVRFDSKFWLGKLKELDYPIKLVEMDFKTLREQKTLPSELDTAKVTKLYSDDYVEVALIKVESKKLKRSLCTKTARVWKQNRLIKPLLLFTDSIESYAVIVPGKGIGGEAKVLGLSDILYRTDLEVLESMRFPANAFEFNKYYDFVLFPYEKVRNDFF